MPGRDPDAAQRSAAVAAEIRAVMKQQGLSGAELADRLRDAGVQVSNAMWVTRRLTGQVNLVEPERVIYGPTDDLAAIAEVLKVDPKRFVRVVNSKASHAATSATGGRRRAHAAAYDSPDQAAE
jgi:transcriptional regulator with XRE-family HTH domain